LLAVFLKKQIMLPETCAQLTWLKGKGNLRACAEGNMPLYDRKDAVVPHFQ